MKREFSAGGIVFNKKGQVLLIHNIALRDSQKSYWGFPKGHLNQGESSKEAALREIEEETGIKAEIEDKVGDSKYVFTQDREKIFKVVSIFLMRCKEDQITHQSSELLEADWFPPDEALKKLSFKKDKELLKKVLVMI